MSQLIRLEAHCVHCHGRATLYLTHWKAPMAARDRVEGWACPACSRFNETHLPGKLEAVTLGHDSPSIR